MATGNNRKENTFKPKATPEAELLEEQPIITEETKKEEKPKKAAPKKSEKAPKSKETQPKKDIEEKENTGRIGKIIGILFICLAVFLGIALVSYLVSFFSGGHQEYGYQIFNQKVNIENRTGSLGVFLAQTLIKESFGIGSFFFVYLLTLIGLRLTEATKIKMWNIWKWALLCLVWMPLFFAFIATMAPKCAIHHPRLPLVGVPCLPIQPYTQLFQGKTREKGRRGTQTGCPSRRATHQGTV